MILHIPESTIARLDSGTLTRFGAELLAAHLATIGVAPDRLVVSQNLTANDAGLDALLRDIPAQEGEVSLLPVGVTGVQFKAVKSVTPSSFRLDLELRKPGPKRLLSAGEGYVLVTSQELNPLQRENLENALAHEARAVVREEGLDHEPTVRVWDARTLASLSRDHPGVAVEMGISEFGQAQSLPEVLAFLRAGERPFQSDAARTATIDRIRERAHAASDDPQLLRLHGDPGAGKTRTVAEALNADELRNDVLYVNGDEGLQVLLTRLSRIGSSRGILVADEVSDTEAETALRRAGGMHGRWRLITISSLQGRRWVASGSRNVVLPPLDQHATKVLVERHSGLPAAQAAMVAEVAAGFPELAFRLAEELRGNPDLDLVRLARLPSSDELLNRAFTDIESRRHIAPVALFTAVGYDGDLEYEILAVAHAFELDPGRLKLECDRELGRFVSAPGRYRAVSPRLVAIWLATDLIEKTTALEDRVEMLPPSLQAAFTDQLSYFGPDAPHLPDALRRVLARDRFRDRDHFDEAAGRFLRASAAIVPAQVGDAIRNLLEGASPEELRLIPRRDLVSALQLLLWSPETWQLAASYLLRLANEETESWANNATGAFIQAFGVFLSGTTIPYGDRSAWLSAQILAAGPSELRILSRAAAAGLQEHGVRSVVGFHGGGEPTDWAPESREALIGSRARAWAVLMTAYDRSDAETRADIAREISHGIRVMSELGRADDVVRAVRARDWSTSRPMVASGIRNALRYGELDARTGELLRDLLASVIGGTLAERLTAVLGTPIWDLREDRGPLDAPPPTLVDLVDEVVQSGDRAYEIAFGVAGDDQTRFAFLRELARRLGVVAFGRKALSNRNWEALAAALSLGDERDREWVDETLVDLARHHPAQVPLLLTYVDITDERLRLALDLVDSGSANSSPLARLMFGARLKALPFQNVSRAIRAVAVDQIEPAVSMFVQWLEDAADVDQNVSELADELAQRALAAPQEPMLEFSLTQLVKLNVLGRAAILRMWNERVTSPHGLSDELDAALLGSVLSDPETARPVVYDVAKRLSAIALFEAGRIGILSRLAEVTSPASVWQDMVRWPEDELRWAVHHLRWTGDRPDALTRMFLTSPRLSGLEDEASVCFRNTLGVVVGPYHLGLANELVRAENWKADLRGTTAAAWTEELIGSLAREIEYHRQREAEQAARF